LPWPFQLKITGAYRQRFADARSRVIEKQQQGVIAFPITTPTINGGDHRTGLFRFQISGGPSWCFFVANRENATVLTGPRYIVPQEVLHKTANRGKTAIPGNRSVPSMRFDMI